MRSSTIFFAALLVTSIVSFSAGYPSLSIDPDIDSDVALGESRNILQQLLINQVVNMIPENIRNAIDNAAILLGMSRNDFLLRCLKELQAFQTYSKIDFITAIQKLIQYIKEQLTYEQTRTLQVLEPQGIEVATLLFSNQLQTDHLKKIYDFLIKIIRVQIKGQAFVAELPKLIDGLLLHYNSNAVPIV